MDQRPACSSRAPWYRACGVRLLRIVIVVVQTGAIGLRVFVST